VEEGVTADHIPPKLLLARPYPNNLPTVPACRRCNASFQADDEYTRFVISIDVRTAAQRTAQSNMPAILRSLQRPEAGGFARYISNQITDTMVLGADGRPMAQAVEADRGRIHATGERIIRGLFFIETGERLPHSTRVRIASKAGVTPSEVAIQQFARMYASSSDRRSKTIGDAFSYVVAFYPQFSLWFLLLYDHFSWIATIGSSSDATK
jgi:hypothetical protein